MKQKLIAVVGPTASGKSELAIRLSECFQAEVVSADSMQIYREMNIGTAKPSPDEMRGIPHHLIGFVPVTESYSVVSYVRDARAVLSGLEKKRVTPVLCGGTGLYIDHLLQNTDFFDLPVDAVLRNELNTAFSAGKADELYRALSVCDPVLAAKIHPNDAKRVIRGLEVYRSTGIPLSEWQEKSRRESPFDVLYLGMDFKSRALLYERINSRVTKMRENGLLGEARSLWESKSLSDTARAAIGYKELMDAFENGSSPDDAFDLVRQKTRNYAKRQLSWFHRNREIHWLLPDENKSYYQEALALCSAFLEGGREN